VDFLLYCGDKLAQRAVNEGSVELLGGFSKMPPSGSPGWLFRLRLPAGKEILRAIVQVMDRPTYTIIAVDNIVWKYWIGDKNTDPIMYGDHPLVYKQHKKDAL
jgi:hypothetical protein